MNITDADKAYHEIKERIITLNMRPGEVIQETHLMDELALGRTPIREALKRLEAENLVVVKPRRGMFVADIAITDLIAIYEVRIELEALAARLAAQRITPRQREQLCRLVEEYENIDRSNPKTLFDIDRRFHTMLASSSQNRFLRKEMELFYNLSLRIWYVALNYIQPDDLDVDAHLDIIDAIQQGDAALAEERMREHIDHFHRAIKQSL